MRQDMKAPNNLRDRHRGNLFQLQLDHGKSFAEITEGQLNDAQEDLVGGEPGDVQFTLEKIPPVFADEIRWQRLARGSALLTVQGKATVAGVELPDLAAFGPDLQHGGGMDCGPGFSLRHAAAARAGCRFWSSNSLFF